jgi:hypothetical protein
LFAFSGEVEDGSRFRGNKVNSEIRWSDGWANDLAGRQPDNPNPEPG